MLKCKKIRHTCGLFLTLSLFSVGFLQTSFAAPIRCDELFFDPFAKRPHEYLELTPSDRYAPGSQENIWFTDQNGKFYFGKSYGRDKERVLAEHLANQIYSALRVKAPKSTIQRIDGVAYVLAPEIKGKHIPSKELAQSTLKEDFIIDAWLAHWDVIGAYSDNVIVSDGYMIGENKLDEGSLYRLDTGGALLWKGMSGYKEFPNEVKELESMRNPQYGSGQVFGSLTRAEIVGQIRKFAMLYAENREQILHLVDHSGLSSNIKSQISQALDARAKWLLVSGLKKFKSPLDLDMKKNEAEWVAELQAELGSQIWAKEIKNAQHLLEKEPAIYQKFTLPEIILLYRYVLGNAYLLNEALYTGLSGKTDWSWLGEEKAQYAAKIVLPKVQILNAALDKLSSHKGQWIATSISTK